MSAGRIRVGIGGWTYAPWRGTFYPRWPAAPARAGTCLRPRHRDRDQRTFYGRQKPESFEKWAAETPDGFVFALKASRYCVNRRVLAEAGESVARFLDQGITRLGAKLGPILWQFAATKPFDREDFARFLALLPPERDGLPLRHAVEPRHESFRDPRFVDLVRDHGAAIVVADAARYPQIADLTADFVYARLQDQVEEEPAGYAPAALDRWAGTARRWAAGEAPDGLAYAGDRAASAGAPRDLFVFMINGAKVRAPAAAAALIARLEGHG